MKILFMEWKSLGQADIVQEFGERGWKVDFFPFPREEENTRLNHKLCEEIVRAIAGAGYDFVFSFNYFPVISIACNACRVKYVSWTFDSPFIQLYSNTISYPYNYVFIFDKGTCEELWGKGIQTVYYLPMAAPVSRYDSYQLDSQTYDIYKTDISFIGSTYKEKKNRFYERLSGVSEKSKGYLDGLVQSQKMIYGDFILERLLIPEVLEDMMSACPLAVNIDGFERLEWVYANYFIARYVTALEREAVLNALSHKFKVDLYTYEQTPELEKVRNMGTAEIMKEAPLIYRCSKINLNISLKSILTGIPLRVFEIMGSGGFLASNYQEDFLEFFRPDEDFICYMSLEELMDKVEYYMVHEKERLEIAENGYRKVKMEHTYKQRVDNILENIM